MECNTHIWMNAGWRSVCQSLQVENLLPLENDAQAVTTQRKVNLLHLWFAPHTPISQQIKASVFQTLFIAIQCIWLDTMFIYGDFTALWASKKAIRSRGVYNNKCCQIKNSKQHILFT